jgi:hypothetical protein
MSRALFLAAAGMLATLPAFAETVSITGAPIYVTKSDCQAVLRHQPSADVTYQPGTDVHGHYVAPADLGGGADVKGLVPDTLKFDIRINPMTYGKTTTVPAAGATTAAQGNFANTSVPVAHVEIDMKSGATSLNGKTLGGEQERIVGEACRRAGIH